MPTPTHPIVIVGSGLTAASAAEGLRDNGYDGPLVMIGAEPYPPYHRPALSKGYLQGMAPRAELDVFSAERWTDLDVQLRSGVRAVGLRPEQQRVVLDDGDDLAYHRLLLATGATPRRLPIPGADRTGVHYLRTVDDSDRLRRRLAEVASLAVIGAGWIGTEVAATARSLGLDVTLVDPQPVPLAGALGPDLAGFIMGQHVDNGVHVVMGEGIAAIEGNSHVERIRTTAGRVISAELVVAGVGAVPDVELGRAAGLATTAGIEVDSRLRTSAPWVFAAGDAVAAEHRHYGGRQRFEHWQNAKDQGRLAAATMLDLPGANEQLPYFFSTQYGRTLELVGRVPATGRLVEFGDVTEPGYQAVWLDSGGRPVAAVAIDAWGAVDRWRPQILAGQPAQPEALRSQTLG